MRYALFYGRAKTSDKHCRTMTKCPALCKRRFQINFLEWKCLQFDPISLKFVIIDAFNNKI